MILKSRDRRGPRVGILARSAARDQPCYCPAPGARGRQGGTLVVGLGVDLVETSRVETILARWGATFLAKIMEPAESLLLPEGGDRVRAVALAIAGKEAASKALGTGWSRGVRWRDVVVDLGDPSTVRLTGGALAFARGLGSSGRTRSILEIRGGLAVGEVWLLT